MVHGIRRHVPELAIEWALDAPERNWRAVEGTLLFGDISGFTALAERLAQRGRVGGEELVETLSRVFAAMLEIAHARGGMLLKFGGDALLLFFDGEGHGVRAACAAVEMRIALRQAAELPTSVGPLKLSMSVGIHSGDVDFFLVGATHRELVLLGPATNIVVATENAANAGEILVSAATAALLPRAAVRPRDDGQLMLRWRRAPLPATGHRPQRSAPAAIVDGLFPQALRAHLAAAVPEPEHRVACIAFARFTGTDALLAAAGAAALAAALEITVGTVQQCIEAEGVSLLAIDIDRDGGKFFLGSGVPAAHEDDEGAMLRALRRIASAHLPLSLQMGVNRGHVFVAEVGAPGRAAYSAMGDTTNTAARIAGKAPPGAIYVHPSVLDQCLTLFEVQPVGPFTFKGKKAPLVVYEVGEEIGLRQREGLETDRFVGRTQEQATLGDAVAALMRGRGDVIRIVGDSGLGKSRLVRESIAQVRGATVAALRAEPYGARSPYRLFRDPLRALLGIARAGQVAMAAALQDLIARVCPQVAELTALIGEIVLIEVAASAAVQAIAPNFRAGRRADALFTLLGALHAQPLIFVVDDAHWADEASVALLALLARECAVRPWLMLVARRDTEGGFNTDAGRELRLLPLADDALRSLVEIATEAAPLRPHDTDEIVRRAHGNPLFAMEILRAAREVGSVDAVPNSLEAAMAAQVDALDPAARRVLRYATVLGRSFARDLLHEILTTEHHGADVEALDRLGEFLETDGDERFRFRNGLLRDAIYEGVAYRLRLRLHGVAGVSMEHRSTDIAANADALALHFSRADDAPRAWRYARLAGDRARRSYANLDAARFYEMAIAAMKRLPALEPKECVRVWVDLGDVRELAARFDASFDAYRCALAIVGDDPVVRADLLLGRARAKERAGRFTGALRDLNAGLRGIEGDESKAAAQARARLSSFSAMVIFGQDRPRRALQQARIAVAQARAAGEKLSLGRALTYLDLAQLALHGPGRGEHLKEALAIFEELGDIRMQANVRNNLGFLNAIACRWDEAVQWLKSGRDFNLRSGDAVGAAYSGMNTGEILINQRRYEEAEPLLADALRVMRASQFAEGVVHVEIQLARILIERGAVPDADALLVRVVDEFSRLGKSILVLEATVVRADGLLCRGDPAGALDLLEAAEALAGKDAGLLLPKTAWIRGRALAALGRAAAARAALDAGLQPARAQHLLYEEALLLAARAALGDAAADAGGHDAARAQQILAELGVTGTPGPGASRLMR